MTGKRFTMRPAGELVRCELCGEGIGPGIRPNPKRHGDAVECFRALQRAIRDTRDCLHELVAAVDAKDLRIIKTTFGVERTTSGASTWSITVTDPLGNEDRMARLVANTWAAVFEASVNKKSGGSDVHPEEKPDGEK